MQEKDETSRAYLSRWLDMKNSCAGVHTQTAMAAFIDGLEWGTLLRHKLKRLQGNHQLDLNQMIQLASDFAAADDDARGSLLAMVVPTQLGGTAVQSGKPLQKKINLPTWSL